MNQREQQQQIDQARKELKAFYGACAEISWARDEGVSGVSCKASTDDVVLMKRSPLAYQVMSGVINLVTTTWELMGADHPKEFYEEHRDMMSEKLFQALEATIEK